MYLLTNWVPPVAVDGLGDACLAPALDYCVVVGYE